MTLPYDYTQIGAATFVPPNGTVTFGAGNSTATVTVDPSTDVTSEPDETVILTLAAGAGYNVINPNSATGTIQDDDNSVSVVVSPGSVDEDGATNLVYTFTRTDPSGALDDQLQRWRHSHLQYRLHPDRRGYIQRSAHRHSQLCRWQC